MEKEKVFTGIVAKMDSRKRRNLLLTCIALIAIVVFLYFANNGFVFDNYGIRVLNLCMIYSVFSIALNLVQGFTGLFSLGSAGFMAVGAYTTTLLLISPELKQKIFYLEPIVPWLANVELPFVVSLLLGGLMGAIFALFIGIPVLRLTGDYLSVATLGFSEIIRILFVNLQSLTNGATGIKNIPRAANLWWTGGVLAIVLIFMVRLLKSSYGRAFQAIRDDQTAAQAMGINLFKHKLLSFVTYAFMTAIAGGLMASILGAINPTLFRYVISYDILLTMVLGGTASLTGSIVGAFIFVFAKEALRFLDSSIKIGSLELPAIPGLRMVAFSILLMIVAVYFSRGLMGGREFSWDGLFGFFKNLPRKIFRKRSRGCVKQ